MAAPWTDVIHQRLLKVHVRWELADAALYLANLMLVTDGMAARAQIKGVFAMITRVADELNPAELLTLRGDTVDPAALHRAHP
jgi:cob(I)alamin adenosyltransferase